VVLVMTWDEAEEERSGKKVRSRKVMDNGRKGRGARHREHNLRIVYTSQNLCGGEHGQLRVTGRGGYRSVLIRSTSGPALIVHVWT